MPLYVHENGERCRTVLDSCEDDRLRDSESWTEADEVDETEQGKATDSGKAEQRSGDTRTGTGRATVTVGASGGDA